MRRWNRGAASAPRARRDRCGGATSRCPPTRRGPMLPFGLGRSYGDSCLNQGGTLLLTRGLSRFISFDPETGLLACEAGVTLAEILERFAPLGWFLPVVPGTKYVTVGGAIANDIHGKNHHRAGTFGAHVRGSSCCARTARAASARRPANAELFAATIGGLGLTGLVTWAELRLRRIPSPWMLQETVPFQNLDAFFELSARSDATHEYTVAWIDCLARGEGSGAGSSIAATTPRGRPRPGTKRRAGGALRPPRLRAQPPLRERVQRAVPLEEPRAPASGSCTTSRSSSRSTAWRRWNRIYGRRGLLQFQCVVPFDGACDGAPRRARRHRALGAGLVPRGAEDLRRLPSARACSPSRGAA